MDELEKKEEEVLDSDTNKEAEGDEKTTDPYEEQLKDAQEALAAREKQLGQAEHNIVELKKKNKELENGEVEEEEEESEAEGIDVDKLTRDITANVTRDIQTKDIVKALGDIDNENERKLTQLILENDIKPSGDALKDVRRARLLANEHSSAKKMEEVMLAAQSEVNRKRLGEVQGGGNQTMTAERTDADRKVMEAFGVTEEQITKNKAQE